VQVMQLWTASARFRLSLVQCAHSAACLKSPHSWSIGNVLVYISLDPSQLSS
jgi:hypothetical protein